MPINSGLVARVVVWCQNRYYISQHEQVLEIHKQQAAATTTRTTTSCLYNHTNNELTNMNLNLVILTETHQSLGIQSYCQRMIRVSSHLPPQHSI